MTRLFPANCRHRDAIVVRSAGMERIVCESCGHVSFTFDHTTPKTTDEYSPDLETADR